MGQIRGPDSKWTSLHFEKSLLPEQQPPPPPAPSPGSRCCRRTGGIQETREKPHRGALGCHLSACTWKTENQCDRGSPCPQPEGLTPPSLTPSVSESALGPGPMWTQPVAESGRGHCRDPDSTVWGVSPRSMLDPRSDEPLSITTNSFGRFPACGLSGSHSLYGTDLPAPPPSPALA